MKLTRFQVDCSRLGLGNKLNKSASVMI